MHPSPARRDRIPAKSSYSAPDTMSHIETLKLVLPPVGRTLLRRSRSGPRHALWSFGTEVLAETLQMQTRRILELPITTARALLEARVPPETFGVRVESATLGGVPGEWLVPPGSENGPVVLYIHGGGHALGSPRTHRPLAARLARYAAARVFSPHYRLAPEHPFPADVDDCSAVYRALLESDLPPERLVLGGDSAGGALTLTTLLVARDAGLPLPAGAFVLSPWVDLELRGATIDAHADFDYLSRASLSHFTELYLHGVDPRTPLVSPLRADLRRLPPLLIHAGGVETLLDEGRELAQAAERAGVDVRLEVWDGMIHAWHAYTQYLPQARSALRSIGEFVRRSVERASARRIDARGVGRVA